MVIINKCRAKDPSTCWRHGDPTSVSLKNLFEPQAAEHALRSALRGEEEAFQVNDSEAFLDARHAVVGASLDLDATLKKQYELKKEIQESFKDRGRQDVLKARLEQGKLRRAELLEKDSVGIHQKVLVNSILEQNEVRSFSPQDFVLAFKELNALPMGTPFLVRTQSGWFIDSSSNGINGEKELKGVEKFFNKPYFVYPNAVSVVDASPSWRSNKRIRGSGAFTYESFHQLDDDFSFSPGSFVPEGSKKILSTSNQYDFTVADSYPAARYAVVGEKFYYEVEGALTVRRNGELVVDVIGDAHYFEPNSVQDVYKIPAVVKP